MQHNTDNANTLDLKVYGFNENQKQLALERLYKKLEADDCQLIDCDKSQDVWVAKFQVPEGYTPKEWYDSLGWTIFWLFIFFPVGFYGLFKSKHIPLTTRKIVGSIAAILILSFYSLEKLDDKKAKDAGFASYSDYSQAQKLDLHADAYYQHKQAAAKAQQEKEAAEKAKAFEEADYSSNAIAICKIYVKRSILSPSSADFPWPDKSRVWKRSNQTYIVKSYVDSQNQFGAMVRSQWHCEARLIGERKDKHAPSSWNLITLEIL